MVVTRESKMPLGGSSAFQLMLATSWLAPAHWRDHQDRAILAALNSGPDWDEYFALVDWHRTPALSWEALRRTPKATLPAEVSQALQQRSTSCQMRAMRLASMLIQVLEDFNHAGIPLIPLKGPLLSLEIYGNLAIRHSRDIDIMVALDDMSRAQACLEKIGWRVYIDEERAGMTQNQEVAGAGGWIVEAWELSRAFSPRHTEFLREIGHHTVYWHPVQQCLLELHWRTHRESPDHTAGQWARSTALTWHGFNYRSLSAVDLALHLCEHGNSHCWSRAKWLGDVARIYAANYVDWSAAFRSARALGEENSLLLCLRLLSDLYGLPLPEELAAPAGRLPSLFLDRVALSMLNPAERHPGSALATLRMAVSRLYYERWLHRRRSWREIFADLAFCKLDFELLRLPDRLFWLYIPLRPILWVRRCLSRIAPKA